MSGNPFKKGKDKQPLSGGVRSDEWDDDQEDEVPPPPLTRQAEGPAGYPPPAPFARPTEGPGPAGYPPLSTSASAGLATAGSGAPPPPGGGAPQPVAGVPAFPPPSAAAPPGAAAPDPYQIPAPAPSTAPYAYGSSGAWGGAPPVSGYPQQGVYGLSSDGPAGYAPQQGAAWTGGYATEQPLTYSTFEQQAGGPQVPMRCWGMGEQWLLFIVGILIWPLWYCAVLWYMCSDKQKTDPRQRTPFILNCVASFIFTIIWIAVVVRETTGWNCYGGWC